MKILVALIMMTSLLLASNINWYSNYNEARSIAKTEHKPIIVMITASWCGVCNMMKNSVFTDSKIIKKQNAKFISVMLDKDKNVVPKEFKVYGTPTFYFLDYKGELVEMYMGGSNMFGWNEKLDK